MTDVSYFGKGTVASPAGSVSSITVPWPASVVDGQLAILVVAAPSLLFPTQVGTPSGWQAVDYKFDSTGVIVVFSQTTAASPASVVVPLSSFFGASLPGVDAQIYVFNNTIRATKRGQGITINPGNAGLWITGSTFSGGSLTVVDTLPDNSVGYLISAGGQYYKPNQTTPGIISSIELEHRPGPAAPTVLGPSLESSSADDPVYRWLPNSVTPQTKFQIQVRTVGSGTWSHVKSDGTLTTTVTEVPSAQTLLVSPAASYMVSTGYEFAIRSFDGFEWSPFSPTTIFTLVPPPVVTVSAPSSGLSNDLTPTVTWSSTFSGARSQIAYRVTATAASGYLVYDSGVRLDTVTTFTMPPQDDFMNGEAVTFRVYVTQTSGATGVGSTTQTVSWTPPTNPTIAVANTSPGVQLTIVADIDDVVDIQRSTDGSTWTDIATSLPVRIVSTLIVHDVLAPYAVPVTYRVRAAETLDATKLTTGWIVSSSITSADDGFYLVDTLDPLNFVETMLQSDASRQVARGGTVSYGLGSLPTVDYGPTQGDSGQFSVLTQSQDEAELVFEILTLGRPVWLRWPPDEGVDIAPTKAAVTPDPIVHERRIQGPFALRDWPVKWVEQ